MIELYAHRLEVDFICGRKLRWLSMMLSVGKLQGCIYQRRGLCEYRPRLTKIMSNPVPHLFIL